MFLTWLSSVGIGREKWFFPKNCWDRSATEVQHPHAWPEFCSLLGCTDVGVTAEKPRVGWVKRLDCYEMVESHGLLLIAMADLFQNGV